MLSLLKRHHRRNLLKLRKPMLMVRLRSARNVNARKRPKVVAKLRTLRKPKSQLLARVVVLLSPPLRLRVRKVLASKKKIVKKLTMIRNSKLMTNQLNQRRQQLSQRKVVHRYRFLTRKIFTELSA